MTVTLFEGDCQDKVTVTLFVTVTLSAKRNEISMPWHIYIIKCKDSNLYTGITKDLERRVKEHNSDNGCRFTKGRSPVKLVYSEKIRTRSNALKREAAIKRLPRKKKLELIKRG